MYISPSPPYLPSYRRHRPTYISPSPPYVHIAIATLPTYILYRLRHLTYLHSSPSLHLPTYIAVATTPTYISPSSTKVHSHTYLHLSPSQCYRRRQPAYVHSSPSLHLPTYLAFATIPSYIYRRHQPTYVLIVVPPYLLIAFIAILPTYRRRHSPYLYNISPPHLTTFITVVVVIALTAPPTYIDRLQLGPTLRVLGFESAPVRGYNRQYDLVQLV